MKRAILLMGFYGFIPKTRRIGFFYIVNVLVSVVEACRITPLANSTYGGVI